MARQTVREKINAQARVPAEIYKAIGRMISEGKWNKYRIHNHSNLIEYIYERLSKGEKLDLE